MTKFAGVRPYHRVAVRRSTADSICISVDSGLEEMSVEVSRATARALASYLMEFTKEPTFIERFDALKIGDKFQAGGDRAIKVSAGQYVLVDTSNRRNPPPMVTASFRPDTFLFREGW